MKNRLEDEYRQLMQNETPDLWERISAGIDAKIAADNETQKETTKEVTKQVIYESENQAGIVVSMEAKQPVTNKKHGTNFWKKYSLPLVACIAAVLCVPLMLTGFLRMAGGGAKSETAAADMADTEQYSMITEAPAEEYFAEAVVEEEAAEEAVMEEAAAEEEAAPEEIPAEEMAEEVAEDAPAEAPESVLSEGIAVGAMDNASSMSDGKTDVAGTAQTESAIEDMNDSIWDRQELQNTESASKKETQILTVIEFSMEEGVMEEERAKGTIYYLTTEEQGECTVFVPFDLAFVIDLNQQLKIVVEQGNDEYDYVFVKIAE